MLHWQVMGEYNAETTTFTAFAGGGGSSPYTPPVPGRLKGVRLLANRAAATSLINGVVVKMSCALFSPNAIEFAIVGGGLQTAPIAAIAQVDYQVDQPVAPGNPIKMEGKNISETDTPVTVSIIVMGLFESGGN